MDKNISEDTKTREPCEYCGSHGKIMGYFEKLIDCPMCDGWGWTVYKKEEYINEQK
jgi:hypothetical protein